MNIQFIDNLIIPIIVAGCFCIGYIVKKWMPTDDKWIPTIVCVVGGILGFILTENSETQTIVTGIVAGAISGLASTGVHQMIKQHLKLEDPHRQIDTETERWLEEQEAEDGSTDNEEA